MATKAPFNRRLAALELAVDELEIGMFRSPSGPGTISGKAIKPKTVPAGLVNVSSLEAVNAKTGNLSVTGSIVLTTAGKFMAGQTDYDTGVGWYLDYNAGTPRFSLGNSGGNKLTWNGTTLAITGSVTATTGTIGGWVIGATDLTESGGGGTVGLASSGSVRIWVGHATPSSAPFRVSSAGVATMIGAVIGSASSGARVELNPTNGVSVYDSGGTVRGRLLTTGAGYLGSTDGTSATAALSWTTAGVATINASAITTGTLNASGITVTNLNAASITAGTLVADRISGGSLGGGINLGSSNLTLNSSGIISWGSSGSSISSSKISIQTTAFGTAMEFKDSGGTARGSIFCAGAQVDYSGRSGNGGILIDATETRVYDTAQIVVGSLGPLYLTAGNATGAVYLYSNGDVDMKLGDAAGARVFYVTDSGGVDQFGINSNGDLIRPIANDATALGAYYGRVPIYINGALRYLAVYN